MPVLNINNEQVLELIRQLPQPLKAQALRALLADPAWDDLLAYGESRLDAKLKSEGLDRSQMTPDQIELAIDCIARGR